MGTAHPRGAAKGCAGIGDLADRADIRLSEQLCEVSGTTVTEDTEAADGNTNLRSNLRLDYDIACQIAEVEEPATHRVEFRIDQFIHFTHEFPPWGLHVNNIWLEASQCLNMRV